MNPIKLAEQLAKTGELEKAYEIYQQHLEELQYPEKIYVLQNMMVIADVLASVKKSNWWNKKCMMLARKLIKECEKLNNFEVLAIAHLFIGKSYRRDGKTTNARKVLELAHELAEQAKDEKLKIDIIKEYFKSS